jgi:enoyl-CoA hydratase
MQSNPSLISRHDNGAIAVLTIERPKQLNALNGACIAELATEVAKLQGEKNIRAVVLTGSGEKAFVAGADITEFADFNAEEGRALAAKGQEILFNAIANSRVPFVAAINGFALGGGLELALACQLRLAAEGARMGLPEVTLGLIPGYGGTQRLAHVVGRGRAMEMVLTARMVDAAEALGMGLVTQVVEAEALMEAAIKTATKISRNGPCAVGEAIKAVNASGGSAGFEVEIGAFGRLFGTEDFKEGVAAFIEKRKPQFTGT